MKPYVVGFIFARGGSKGVPHKNIRLLANKPLIAYSIEKAYECSLIDRVIVSTDDTGIAKIALQYGAEVPFMRPAELARDDSPEWLAWQHAILSFMEIEKTFIMDVFVSLPPTSPLRAVEDINACIEKLLNSDADVVITAKVAERNPYFNMVILDEEFNARLLIEDKGRVYRRQDALNLYDVTTVAYTAHPEFVLKAKSIFDGKVKVVLVPSERALDIDSEFDFKFAEFILSQS